MREIADGVFEIGIRFVNAHLVVVDDGVVLVDTGLPGRSATIERALTEAGKAIGDVHTILVTHWHADHTGNAADLRRRGGARLVAHAIEAVEINGTQRLPRKGIVRLSERMIGRAEPVPVDELVNGDGAFSVPGFTAIHTPGHTAGHLSYLLDRSGGVLFTGDAAMAFAGRVRHSPGMLAADAEAARSSVARLARERFDVAVFGHGRAVRGQAVDRFRALAGA